MAHQVVTEKKVEKVNHVKSKVFRAFQAKKVIEVSLDLRVNPVQKVTKVNVVKKVLWVNRALMEQKYITFLFILYLINPFR
jgi:hypothetical protein